jgi:prepilin-type N-terminal cleavage/methylation domain-containing protein
MMKKGFSLAELMIVVAIIGILAAIAVPSYMSYMNRTRRTEAVTSLETVALYEEKYFAEHGQYLSSLTNLAHSTGLTNPNSDAKRSYDVAVTVTTTTVANDTFSATATPIAGGLQAGDITFGINSAESRGTWNGATVVDNPKLWKSLKQ